MKNKLLSFIAILIASVGSYSVQAQETGQVTALDDLQTGDVVLIKQTTSGFYLGAAQIANNNSNAALMPYSLYDGNIQFIVTKGGNAGEYNFHVKSTDAATKYYLHGTSNTYSTQIGEYTAGGLSTWIISIDGEGVCQIRNSQTAAAYLGSDNTTAASTLYRDKNNANIYWKIYKVSELQEEFLTGLEAATASVPVDASAFISNPIVATTGTPVQGWSTTKGAGNNGPLLGTGNASFETWSSAAVNVSFDYKQTLNNLPNGVYRFSGQCYNSINGEAAGSTPNGALGIYASAGGTEVFAGVTVDGTTLQDYTTENIVVTDGTLTIGVKNKGTASARWFVADNFSLSYLGFDASALIDQINTLIGSANTAIAERRIERSVQTALQQSITNAQAAIVTGTKEALENAAADLTAKLAAAHASIAEYNEIRTQLDWAQDILTNTNYPGLMNYNDALFAIEQILADQTFEKTRDIAAIKTAVKDYVISQTGATADTPNDYTLIIENNSFETGDTNGWTLSGSSSDTGVRANSNATYKINNADGDYIFNTYSYGFGISQTITGIPNGQYEMSVLIGQDAGGTVTIFANDETKVITHTGDKATGETGTISVTVTNGTLTLGTKDGANWYKVDNFQLQYKGVDIDALKAALKAQIDIAEALSAKLVNTYTAGIESVYEVSYFKGSLSIIQGIYETSNYADQLALVTGTMKNDIANITNFLVNEYSVDVAFAVKNNDFSDGLKNWNINGNVTTRSNEHYSGATNPYFDSDNWDATNWNVNGVQTVTGLEQGLYRLSFTSRASAGTNVAVTLNGGETLTMPVTSAGNQGGELGGGWNTYSAFVLVGYNGSLQISIDASASLANQWMSVDDFKLRKVGTYAMVQDGSHLIASGYLDNNALMFFHMKVSDPYADIRSADVSRTTGDGNHDLVMTPNFIMYGLSDQFSVQNCIDVESGAAITLDLDYPFHAPTGFSSEVSFSRRPFDLPVNHTRAGGWQTICLPFDVDMDNITCDDGKGNLVPITLFEGTSTGLRPFWLYRADATEGLKAATEIKANVPYLMLVPNDTDPETGYAAYYNISGTLTFRGTAIVATDLQAEDAKTYFLNGCFAPIYYGQDNTIFTLDAAGKNFVADLGTRAFTAYANSPVNGSAKVLPVLGGDDATSLPEGIMLEANKNLLVYTSGNGIVNILSTKAAKVPVYTLDGKLFGTYDLTEGVNEIQLPGNKYVINGNVVIVY